MRIHLLGASGSGTTTLGRALAAELGIPLLDSDDYFWLPTEPPFSRKRRTEDRIELLSADARPDEDWVVSGSMMGWGDFLIPWLQLVIYLWKPAELRRERLSKRERARFGPSVDPGGKLRREFETFIAWAMDYDSGGEGMRSRTSEEDWMRALPCPVLRIEGDVSVEESLARALEAIRAGSIKEEGR